jgi:hypothetical protein
MCSGTTDCYRLCSTYSYLAYSMRMTSLIHVLCACGLLQGLHGGSCPAPAPPFGHVIHINTHHIRKYHADIPWNSVLWRRFCDAR